MKINHNVKNQHHLFNNLSSENRKSNSQDSICFGGDASKQNTKHIAKLYALKQKFGHPWLMCTNIQKFGDKIFDLK